LNPPLLILGRLISSGCVSLRLATRVPRKQELLFDELAADIGRVYWVNTQEEFGFCGGLLVYGCRPGTRDLETASSLKQRVS
jgi:hypothetical protein